jgi:hypothetical protein
MKKAIRIVLLCMAIGSMITVLTGAYHQIISLVIFGYLQSLCANPKQVEA